MCSGVGPLCTQAAWGAVGGGMLMKARRAVG